MQQNWELREELLYHQLFENPVICHFCRLSQEILRCDILVDLTQCGKNLCVICFEKMKEKTCQCQRKYIEHYFKDRVKRATKMNIVDKAVNNFNKEQKLRKSAILQGLDPDFANLLAYLHLNPTGSRISFMEMEEGLKRAISERRREERSLNNQKSTRKKAVYIGRSNAHIEETGLGSCGYDLSYSKGLNLVIQSFTAS